MTRTRTLCLAAVTGAAVLLAAGCGSSSSSKAPSGGSSTTAAGTTAAASTTASSDGSITISGPVAVSASATSAAQCQTGTTGVSVMAYYVSGTTEYELDLEDLPTSGPTTFPATGTTAPSIRLSYKGSDGQDVYYGALPQAASGAQATGTVTPGDGGHGGTYALVLPPIQSTGPAAHVSGSWTCS